MAVDLRKPQNLKSILGHCERVVSIVAQQRLEGAGTAAIVAICQREWRARAPGRPQRARESETKRKKTKKKKR